jgi:hypothetical protein
MLHAEREPQPGRDALLHSQRHKPQFAVAVGDQEQHGLLAVLLQLLDPLLDVGGISDRLLRHLDEDVAGGQPLFGGVGGAVNTGDDDALDAVLNLVAGAQILAQRRQIEPERLLRHRILRFFLGLGGSRLRAGADNAVGGSNRQAELRHIITAGCAAHFATIERHEAQFAVAIGDQQQHGFLAVFLQLIYPLLEVGSATDRLLRQLDYDVAGGKPLLGGVGSAVDIGDDDALDAVLDLVVGTQVIAQRRQVEAARLLAGKFRLPPLLFD